MELMSAAIEHLVKVRLSRKGSQAVNTYFAACCGIKVVVLFWRQRLLCAFFVFHAVGIGTADLILAGSLLRNSTIFCLFVKLYLHANRCCWRAGRGSADETHRGRGGCLRVLRAEELLQDR